MRKPKSALVSALLALAACSSAPAQQTCTPQTNAKFQESIMARRHIVEGVMVCGIVAARPYQRGGPHGLHVYIPVRVAAPGGATYLTQVIPNEELDGRIVVAKGDRITALGQFVYPNYRQGYEGLIHDTHPATHRGAADGYVEINGKTYR
jgi:hypothetical protein